MNTMAVNNAEAAAGTVIANKNQIDRIRSVRPSGPSTAKKPELCKKFCNRPSHQHEH